MVLRLEASASGWEAPSLEAPTSPLLLERLRRGIIGDDEVLDGPYGPASATHKQQEMRRQS
jgi:hypothetical protein